MAIFKDVGNSVTLISPEKDYRILDAWGYVSKFLPTAGTPTDDTTGEPTSFVNTETGTNTFVNSATYGELFTITTGATEYNGYSSQVKGTAFQVVAGQPFYVGAKMKLSEATQKDFLFGICGTDTTLTAASSAHAIAVSAGGLFFSKLDGATAINVHTYLAGAQTGTAAVSTAMDLLYHNYEIVSEDGVTIKFYFDGALVGCFTASLPTEALTVSLSYRAGSGAAGTLSVKDLRAVQIIA
jgi:hypothetical protein